MNVIDTHCHLYVDQFDPDRETVVKNAIHESISSILLPAIDSTTHEVMLQTETRFPFCRAMMGLHPCSVKENYEEELELAKQYLDRRKFVAVGEIGLDFYWDKTFTSQQYAALEEQIKWALQYDIPIVIHSRDSIDECLEIIQSYKGQHLKGVFHCFTGNADQARKIMDLNFFMGIGGVVTFKKSGLDQVLQQIGLKHIVLETDAPYLAPVPFRGKRNESSYLKYILEKVAGSVGLSAEEVAKVTTENAEELFGLSMG